MRADQWFNDTSDGATIESMRAERGLPVSQDVPNEISLEIAAMRRLLDEMDEQVLHGATEGIAGEQLERFLKVREVFESLREKIRPLREKTNV